MLTPLNFAGWEGTAWCVPSAFAAVTGVTVARAHEIAAFATSRAIGGIEGMDDVEQLSLASRFGVALRDIDCPSISPEPLRLRDFVRAMPAALQVQPLLLTVARKRDRSTHMVATQYRMVCDNHSKRPIPAPGHDYAAAYVVKGWLASPAP